jgi:hypothetical protein
MHMWTLYLRPGFLKLSPARHHFARPWRPMTGYTCLFPAHTLSPPVHTREVNSACFGETAPNRISTALDICNGRMSRTWEQLQTYGADQTGNSELGFGARLLAIFSQSDAEPRFPAVTKNPTLFAHITTLLHHFIESPALRRLFALILAILVVRFCEILHCHPALRVIDAHLGQKVLQKVVVGKKFSRGGCDRRGDSQSCCAPFDRSLDAPSQHSFAK